MPELVIPRAKLDTLRCGAKNCACESVHIACAECDGESFTLHYSRATGVLRFTCDDCLTPQAVRVASEG